MSKDEIYIAQGKLRDALKDKKRAVAALKAELHEYAVKLTEAAGLLETFLADPPRRAPGAPAAPVDLLKQHLEQLDPDRPKMLVWDLFVAAGEARLLEKQVDEFE